MISYSIFSGQLSRRRPENEPTVGRRSAFRSNQWPEMPHWSVPAIVSNTAGQDSGDDAGFAPGARLTSLRGNGSDLWGMTEPPQRRTAGSRVLEGWPFPTIPSCPSLEVSA